MKEDNGGGVNLLEIVKVAGYGVAVDIGAAAMSEVDNFIVTVVKSNRLVSVNGKLSD